MVETIEGKFGTCYICDNMDVKYGMPSLANQSYQLCLTDPPYNVGFEGNSQVDCDVEPMQEKVSYSDNRVDYAEWCQKWFAECERITRMQIISCGHPNIPIWTKMKEPRDYLIHEKVDGHGLSAFSYLMKGEIFLCYGKQLTKKRPFKFNLIKGLLLNGFNRKLPLKHPCPKSYEFYRKVIIEANPSSVLDCFAGSGTVPSVCEELGKHWIAWEMSPKYIKDIKLRIKDGQRNYGRYGLHKKQITFDQYTKSKFVYPQHSLHIP